MESAKESSPTLDFYAQLQRAFDHFNEQLFDGKLPPCLITLRSSYRHYGYHHADRFVNKQGQTLDELGLHPGFFTLRPVEEVLSYLVHEMVHHWQDRLGQPSKSNPHNKEWAQKMREVGLEPSSTGLPSGKDTGQSRAITSSPMVGSLSPAGNCWPMGLSCTGSTDMCPVLRILQRRGRRP